MNILVATDRYYLKYLKVLMASAYENHNTAVNFYVMHDFMAEDDQKSLISFAESFSQAVCFLRFDTEKYSALFDRFKSSVYTSPTFFRLFAHEFLPETMDRILYLDIDTVINGDLTEYYNLDFEGCYLIASKEQYDAKDEPECELESFERITDFDISEAAAGSYLQAGVCLINLEKFRKEQIDLQYYLEKIEGLDKIFYDQGILNTCFAQETKVLTTCVYNYRLHFSAKDYFQRKNDHTHGKREYTFYPVNARIIHYCGILPGARTKAWSLYFDRESDITDPRKEFFDLIPECIPYFQIWWKYAKMTPEYEQLLMEAKINTAAYKMVKKITLEKRQEFCNTLALENYYVPAGTRERNSVLEGDDLNTFTRPGVYRCANAQIKATVQNLPKSYTEKCGFRLTVKHIHSNAKNEICTSTIQSLELNHPSAMVYRRYCGNPEKGTWGKWNPVASTKEIEKINKAISELEKIKNSTSWKITKPLRWLAKKLRTLKKKVKSCLKH